MKAKNKRKEAARADVKTGYSVKIPWRIQPGPDGRVCRYQAKTFKVELVQESAPYPLGKSLRSSQDVEVAARAIYRTIDADKESFILLALNNKNYLQGFKVISTGSLTASLVHPREIWRAALHFCAAAVIFVHNHPSGNPEPSQEDIDITRRLKETGDLMGVRTLEHVIIGDEKIFSFSDRGMI